jgi:V8-like Glu-specific endopeptidase
MRVHFDSARTRLGGATLLMTSEFDGHSQRFNKLSIEQWSHASAYFNGDAVRVELIASPESGDAEVVINGVTVGEDASKAENPGTQTLCDGFDGRTWNNRPEHARYMIEGGGGCTIWLIDDDNHCFLTAGHCGSASGGVAEFNVPMSTSSGSVQHPPPEHQYALDKDSVQYTNGGIGNDWKYVGSFPNSETGKTAAEAQGDWNRVLRNSANAPKAGDLVEHFGYGTATYPDRTFSQVQKGTRQKIYSISGSAFRHRCDTTGGDSGSAVVFMDPKEPPNSPDGRWRGRAVAIHTHGGCGSSATSSNAATFILESEGLQRALAAPKGVCAKRNSTGLVFN